MIPYLTSIEVDMQLLSVDKITKIYHSKVILDELSFTINDNDRIALIGRNGTGKSTLLKILNGNEKPDSGHVQISRNIVVGMLDQNILSTEVSTNPFISPKISELENQMRSIEFQISSCNNSPPQDLLSQYSKLSDEFNALGGHHFEHEMKAALSGLGLNPEHAQIALNNLSGGERMRLELARLLVQKPDILLLDEPTNHLDDDALEWLENYLSNYNGAVVLVSHDRYFIDRTSSRIFEIENNSIHIYNGNYSAYSDQKKSNYDHLERLIYKLEKDLEHQKDVKQTMLSHRKMNSYHSREKKANNLADIIENEKKRLGKTKNNMRFSVLKTTFTGDPNRILFDVKSLSLSYDNTDLFQNASFYIKAQDKVFLCGPNGCGKTSLIKLLMGHLQNFQGDILYYGNAKMAYMGQFVTFENESLTIFETLACNSDMIDQNIFGALAQFGFVDTDIEKPVSVLSGGERSRLYLCLLLQERPDILILDEPTNHLDIISREILENALCAYDGAIIAVSHDRFFIDKCASCILGFIDHQISPFKNMNDYRKAFKNYQTHNTQNNNCKIDKTDSEKTIRKQPSRKNRALERKTKALRKERLTQLEIIIHKLEKDMKDMESSFDAQTRPEVFTQYAQMQEDLDQYFQEYLSLSAE